MIVYCYDYIDVKKKNRKKNFMKKLYEKNMNKNYKNV